MAGIDKWVLRRIEEVRNCLGYVNSVTFTIDEDDYAIAVMGKVTVSSVGAVGSVLKALESEDVTVSDLQSYEDQKRTFYEMKFHCGTVEK